MTEMSIGFHDVKNGSVWSDDFTERTVTDMRLREASIVEDGANELTMASIRSLAAGYTGHMSPDEARQAIAFLEQFLDDEPEQIERSGLVVTDDLIALMAKRHGF
jgi:phage head maturation protease